jgi:hypothetical protein
MVLPSPPTNTELVLDEPHREFAHPATIAIIVALENAREAYLR